MANDITIQKIDSERQLVFGWANVSIRKDGALVVDSQGDSIEPSDLEDAAYLFNLSFRKSGEMHRGSSSGDLVESFVVTPEKLTAMGLSETALPLGWWVGFKIHDAAVFAKVKTGAYKAFSIQGKGRRTTLPDVPSSAPVAKTDETPDAWLSQMETALHALVARVR